MNKSERILQNRYLVEELIGTGGMGAVYLAIDQRFGTNVAIKETVAANLRMSRAFEHEAQLLNSLRHPALPHVVDYFVEDDGQFIVMEYIAGEDLSEILKRQGAFKLEDVLRWADDLLDALNYLHSQMSPVVHRDIKPQNLKLTPRGEIVLLDFGLAKGNPGELSHLTMTTSIFGYSRSYASLEQIQGTGTDPRSDLYSLSSTLYHLLTGQPPVDALTRAKAILNAEPDLLQPVNSFNQQIPPFVADVLHQALALNASLRPQTAVEMRSALKDAILQSESLMNSTSGEDLTEITQISNRNESPKQSLRDKFLTAKIASNSKNSKPQVTAKQEDAKPIAVQTAAPKKLFLPTFATAIAAAILIVFGAAFALFNNPILSFPKTNSNGSEFESTVDSKNIKGQETLTPNVTDSQLSQQTADPATLVREDEASANKEKAIVAASPLTSSRQTSITIKQKDKPVTFRQTANNRRPEKEIAIKEEPIRQSEEGALKKTEVKSENQKRNGFKGILNKISSGAMYIPKNIFKKKKD